MSEQIQKQKNKRRAPTTEEVLALEAERRDKETSERFKRLMARTAIVEERIDKRLEEES